MHAVEGNESSERVLHDAAKRSLDLQINTNEILDSRASGIFSIGSSVLPVTFGLLNLAPNRIPPWSIIFLCLALTAYGILLICAWRSTAYRSLEFRPDIPTLEQYSRNYQAGVLLWWVAMEYQASIEANRDVLERKARWAGGANTALYAEALFLSLAAVLTLL